MIWVVVDLIAWMSESNPSCYSSLLWCVCKFDSILTYMALNSLEWFLHSTISLIHVLSRIEIGELRRGQTLLNHLNVLGKSLLRSFVSLLWLWGWKLLFRDKQNAKLGRVVRDQLVLLFISFYWSLLPSFDVITHFYSHYFV